MRYGAFDRNIFLPGILALLVPGAWGQLDVGSTPPGSAEVEITPFGVGHHRPPRLRAELDIPVEPTGFGTSGSEEFLYSELHTRPDRTVLYVERVELGIYTSDFYTYHLASTDGRADEWPALTPVPQIGSRSRSHPRARVTDDWIYLTWNAEHENLRLELYWTRSRDGRSWEPVRRVDKGLPLGIHHVNNYRFDVQGTANEDILNFCFQRQRTFNEPMCLMFTRSEDGGETFSTPVEVGPPELNYVLRDLHTEGSRIEVVAHDDRTGTEALFFYYSDDGGQTWTPSPLDGERMASYYDAIQDGPRRALLWKKDGGEDPDSLILSTSTDRGVTWTQRTLVGDTNAAEAFPIRTPLGVSRDNLVVAITRRRQSGDEGHELHLRSSDDWGETWHSQLTLSVDRLLASRRLEAGPTFVAVHDMDLASALPFPLQEGSEETFAVGSLDGGRTWKVVPNQAEHVAHNPLYDAYHYTYARPLPGNDYEIKVGSFRPQRLDWRPVSPSRNAFEISNALGSPNGYVLLSEMPGNLVLGNQDIGLANDALLLTSILTPGLFGVVLRDGHGRTPNIEVPPELLGQTLYAVGVTRNPADGTLRFTDVVSFVP